MKLMLAIFMSSAVLGKMLDGNTLEKEHWTAWQDFLSMDEVQARTNGYLTKQEHDLRYDIFKKNFEKIKAHNKEGHSWKMKMNQFGDMTTVEFKKQILCYHGMEKKPSAEGVFTAPADWTVSESVDWVAKGAVTGVKDQGQCGSCWAFSTTGGIEGRTQIAGYGLTSLSEQDLVDCSKDNSGCNGGLMDYAFEFVEGNNGLCTENAYPYTAQAGYCQDSGCQKVSPISSHQDVSQSTSALEAACDAGPVSIAVDAGAFQYYDSGVLDSYCGTSLDHGVLLVGYGTDDGEDYWKVKNSWGASWGEQGYIRLCRNCNKNDGQGQCGILLSASFPIV